MSVSDEILRSLLEIDDDEGLVKDVSYPSAEELNAQLTRILPDLIDRKEKYLGKRYVNHSVHTNPHGQTFCYGVFGRRPDHVVSTLAYHDPDKGWVADNWVDLPEAHEEDEFKEVFHPDPSPNKYIPLGTIVHNTLQEEDLIPEFLAAIAAVDPVQAAEIKRNYRQEIRTSDPEFCWETLLDAVNKHVPPFTYFGAHKGNSSDFGVWPNEEQIEETAQDKPDELAVVPEGSPLSRGSKYIAIARHDGVYIALLDGATGEEIWRYD